MSRDLDGYTIPESFDGRPARRHTRWQPGAIAIQPSPLACQCPCRIAHPRRLADGCDVEDGSLGQVVVASSSSGQFLLPLCAPCTAVQLDDRRRDAEWEREGWRSAFGGLGQAGVLGTIVAVVVAVVLGDDYGGVWFAAGMAATAGYLAFERRDHARRKEPDR